MSDSHRVEVVRRDNWWTIDVPDVGAYTQVKRLEQVEEYARDAIAIVLQVDEDQVGPLDIHVTVPDDIAQSIDALEAARTAATDASEASARQLRETAQAMHDQGLPMRDIGQLVGLTYQRVSQVLKSPAPSS